MNYYAVDRERWARFNIFEQMGNIGSEVGRSLKYKKNRPAEFELALIRALDLFDATVEDLLRQKSPRINEVLRSKDQYLQIALEPNPSQADIDSIESYFMQFAIAVRLQR
jgi:hypothetical protein